MYSVKYTLGEFRDRILKHLCRYSSNGAVYPSGEKEDIENRLVTSLNIHIARLWHEFPGNTKKCRLSFFAPTVIADIGSFDVTGGDTAIKTVCGKKIGFFMTVSGKGTVSVTTSSGTRTFNSDAVGGERIVIRGSVLNDGVTECVFSFGAESNLVITEFTVYEGVGESDSELLYGCGAYAAYLPSDCAQVLALYHANNKELNRTAYSVIEDDRTVLIHSDDGCGYVMEYVCYPPAFADDGADGQEIYLSPIFADALGYMCAADLCPVNDPELYSRLTYKYREILDNLYTRRKRNSVVNKFYGFVRRRGISFAGGRGGI